MSRLVKGVVGRRVLPSKAMREMTSWAKDEELRAVYSRNIVCTYFLCSYKYYCNFFRVEQHCRLLAVPRGLLYDSISGNIPTGAFLRFYIEFDEDIHCSD